MGGNDTYGNDICLWKDFLSQWVAMMLVAGQNYIDSSGSAIQCMQDKGNGKKWSLQKWLHVTTWN